MVSFGRKIKKLASGRNLVSGTFCAWGKGWVIKYWRNFLAPMPRAMSCCLRCEKQASFPSKFTVTCFNWGIEFNTNQSKLDHKMLTAVLTIIQIKATFLRLALISIKISRHRISAFPGIHICNVSANPLNNKRKNQLSRAHESRFFTLRQFVLLLKWKQARATSSSCKTKYRNPHLFLITAILFWQKYSVNFFASKINSQ